MCGGALGTMGTRPTAGLRGHSGATLTWPMAFVLGAENQGQTQEITPGRHICEEKDEHVHCIGTETWI